MSRYPFAAAFLTFALFAGCDSGSSTASNDGTPSTGHGVDPAVIGTWRGIPGTAGSLDTVRITADSLVSTWAFSLGPAPKVGITFYAVAGTNGKAGRMGTTNGQTVRDNVTYEYILSADTLLMEFQISDVYDTIVNRASSQTHSFVRAN